MIHACARVFEGRGSACHGDDFSSHPPREVEVVDHQVQDDATGPGVVEEPVISRLLGPTVRSRQPKNRGVSDRAGHDCLTGGSELGVEAHHLADQQPDTGLPGRGEHRLAIGKRSGQRLLADDVPSGASRGDCNRSVEMSRGADVHDVCRDEKRLESRRNRHAEGIGKQGRSGRIDVEDDDVDPFRSPCRQVRPADESCADQADSQTGAARSVRCSGTRDGHLATGPLSAPGDRAAGDGLSLGPAGRSDRRLDGFS